MGVPHPPTPHDTGLGIIPPKEIACLAEAIFHEARGEPLTGQLAVGMVVLNRTESPEFHGSICHVVYQPGQFVWVNPKHVEHPSQQFKDLTLFAASMIQCYRNDTCRRFMPYQRLLFFSVGGFTSKNLQFAMKIGNHRFYRLKDDNELFRECTGRNYSYFAER